MLPALTVVLIAVTNWVVRQPLEIVLPSPWRAHYRYCTAGQSTVVTGNQVKTATCRPQRREVSCLEQRIQLQRGQDLVRRCQAGARKQL